MNQYFFNTETCKKLKIQYKLGIWAVVLLLFFSLLVQANTFLSKNEPLHSDILVIEGWLPDYALKQGMQKFQDGEYKLIVTTGGSLERGSYLKEYKDYAHLAKATLVAMGLKEESIAAVSAPDVKRERTYHSALALKRWMKKNNTEVMNFDLASLGPHSRRSTLLFQKAFGEKVSIGSLAIVPEDYDPGRWYNTSEGVRTTINELIAYVYVVLLK